MKILASVSPGEKIVHKGDLVIEGDIGPSASLHIKDGALTVKGDVGADARIQLQLSEALRANQTVSMMSGGTFMSGVTIIGSGASYTSANLSLNMNGRRYLIGNVNINGRIITNDKVEQCGGGVYKITKSNGTASLFSSASSATPKGMATAKIDGVTYKGHEIVVNGDTVLVDGALPKHHSAHEETKKEEEEERMPLKLIVNGTIHDGVSLTSDADMELKAIGSYCTIASSYSGIEANNVGNNSVIDVRNAIKVDAVGSDCVLKSKQYGLTSGAIGHRTRVDVRDEINAGDISDFCQLSSKQYGINAGNIGQQVTIQVRDAIKVNHIGNQSNLSSTQYGIKSGDVGNYVTITVRDGASINRVGDNCHISSKFYGIDVRHTIGTCCEITAREQITADGVGDYSQLTSKMEKIKISGYTGNYTNIKARERISLKDVGRNATVYSTNDEVQINDIGVNSNVSARGDIDIDGYCPDPASLKLKSSRGKVRRPKKLMRHDSTHLSSTISSYTSGNFDNDLNKAIEESKAFSAAASTASVGLFKAKPEAHKAVKIPEAFNCPITLELMDDPVICMLDGNTYERSAIIEWLHEHRTSPLTREKMASGQKVEQVLAKNRAVADAITEFKESYPELFSEVQHRV